MEKVTFYPCKKKGDVRVEYRIRYGRSGQFYYTTDILCSEKDLEKLNPDGSRMILEMIWTPIPVMDLI